MGPVDDRVRVGDNHGHHGGIELAQVGDTPDVSRLLEGVIDFLDNICLNIWGEKK